jgi:hypothetical protein
MSHTVKTMDLNKDLSAGPAEDTPNGVEHGQSMGVEDTPKMDKNGRWRLNGRYCAPPTVSSEPEPSKGSEKKTTQQRTKRRKSKGIKGMSPREQRHVAHIIVAPNQRACVMRDMLAGGVMTWEDVWTTIHNSPWSNDPNYQMDVVRALNEMGAMGKANGDATNMTPMTSWDIEDFAKTAGWKLIRSNVGYDLYNNQEHNRLSREHKEKQTTAQAKWTSLLRYHAEKHGNMDASTFDAAFGALPMAAQDAAICEWLSHYTTNADKQEDGVRMKPDTPTFHVGHYVEYMQARDRALRNGEEPPQMEVWDFRGQRRRLYHNKQMTQELYRQSNWDSEQARRERNELQSLWLVKKAPEGGLAVWTFVPTPWKGKGASYLNRVQQVSNDLAKVLLDHDTLRTIPKHIYLIDENGNEEGSKGKSPHMAAVDPARVHLTGKRVRKRLGAAWAGIPSVRRIGWWPTVKTAVFHSPEQQKVIYDFVTRPMSQRRKTSPRLNKAARESVRMEMSELEVTSEEVLEWAKDNHVSGKDVEAIWQQHMRSEYLNLDAYLSDNREAGEAMEDIKNEALSRFLQGDLDGSIIFENGHFTIPFPEEEEERVPKHSEKKSRKAPQARRKAGARSHRDKPQRRKR